MPLTITEFLEARIAEDEAAAKLTLDPGNMHPYGDTRIPAIKPEEWGGLVQNYLGGPMGDYCARNNPSRVLAECAASRKIVQYGAGLRIDRTRDAETYAQHRSVHWIMKQMARVYIDHPDYREEWGYSG